MILKLHLLDRETTSQSTAPPIWKKIYKTRLLFSPQQDIDSRKSVDCVIERKRSEIVFPSQS